MTALACVLTRLTARVYELNREARTARFLYAVETTGAETPTLDAEAVAKKHEVESLAGATYVADGAEALGLKIVTGDEVGRVYLVTLPTCDWCMEPFERDDGGVADGAYRFCEESCREEWRLNNGGGRR